MNFRKLQILLLVIFTASLGLVLYTTTLKGSGRNFDSHLADQTLTPFSEYVHATVEEDKDGDTSTLSVTINEGEFKDVRVDNVEYGSVGATLPELTVGEKVILGKFSVENDIVFVFTDINRTNSLLGLVVVFFLVALLLGGKHGFTSILGLGFSIFVLIGFISPQILGGKNPFLVTAAGTGLIAVVSVFVSHGLNVVSTLTTVSTLATLLVSGVLSWIAVWVTRLNGTGSETAFLIRSGFGGEIDLRGLLFCGIIIGILGVIDDIASTQIASASEIYKTNSDLSFWQLYSKVARIGKEHVASLINTLVLAYAGAGLPMFLLFSALKEQPLWVLLNSEFMAEEIVRSLSGSLALMLAVPISSFIGCYFISKRGVVIVDAHKHSH